MDEYINIVYTDDEWVTLEEYPTITALRAGRGLLKAFYPNAAVDSYKVKKLSPRELQEDADNG